MKKNIFLLLLVVITIVFFSQKNPQTKSNGVVKTKDTENTSNWFYPMKNYSSRIKYKGFGTYVDENFYEKAPKIFPTHFYGFHAAVDLEATAAEEKSNVPVYVVTTGKILYVGEVQGYGGVVLQQIDNDHIALYGHIKLSSLSLNVGDTAAAGQRICYLGNAYSAETGGERKHLHFGIHKGTDLYFLGHEQTRKELNAQWENPTKFLEKKGAVEP